MLALEPIANPLGGWVVVSYKAGACKRLMEMCRWMGSHFTDWIDYNGVAHFWIFWGKTVLHVYG